MILLNDKSLKRLDIAYDSTVLSYKKFTLVQNKKNVLFIVIYTQIVEFLP